MHPQDYVNLDIALASSSIGAVIAFIGALIGVVLSTLINFYVDSWKTEKNNRREFDQLMELLVDELKGTGAESQPLKTPTEAYWVRPCTFYSAERLLTGHFSGLNKKPGLLAGLNNLKNSAALFNDFLRSYHDTLYLQQTNEKARGFMFSKLNEIRSELLTARSELLEVLRHRPMELAVEKLVAALVLPLVIFGLLVLFSLKMPR